jgi:hypothetical protein
MLLLEQRTLDKTGWQNKIASMKPDGQSNTPPNYTRRMLWVFVGQLMLIAAFFIWNDSIPSLINRIIAAAAIIFPVIAYLTLFAQPSVRQAWRWVFREFYRFALSIPSVLKYWFSFKTVVRLARLVRSMKTFPKSLDGWLAFCLLPFKTYIVVTIPFIYISLKIYALFHPLRRETLESGDIFLEGYLISFLVLLLGALLQALICRAGRATQTLGIFLLGIIYFFVLAGRL